MMNAELVARDEELIIIPTAYRTDYLGVLKAFSHNAHTDPLIRMLDVAQAYTHRIDWSTLDQARALLAATHASAERSDAKLKLASLMLAPRRGDWPLRPFCGVLGQENTIISQYANIRTARTWG